QVELVALEAVAGIVIGSIGSWLAVNRYLRV
ncbi:unnamed protein product, partial [marine sediment metagenome]